MDEIAIPKALEDELLAMIAAKKVGPATRKLEAATGMPFLECSAWVKDRVPWREWYPPPIECPFCGKLLKSDNAKQCLECGSDWHTSAL